MTSDKDPEVLHPEASLTLTELCECLNTEQGFVINCVQFGIVEVAGNSEESWTFTHTALTRIRRAWNLHRDLDINHSGLGVVLDLLDDRDEMWQRMEALEQRLREWEK